MKIIKGIFGGSIRRDSAADRLRFDGGRYDDGGVAQQPEAAREIRQEPPHRALRRARSQQSGRKVSYFIFIYCSIEDMSFISCPTSEII